MATATPELLLRNPELVAPVAPWCVTLDNLELAVLLLTQPWLADRGLRRAELERQLARLAADLPLGPVYFQRVKRAVARLEEIGAVGGAGGGRVRRFTATPRGLAGFILNLMVLRADPTVDGSEFELKRALAAMWNLALGRLDELPEEALVSPESEAFFDELEELTVLGERAVDREVLVAALDVLGLIARQRERVEGLLRSARRRLAAAEAEAEALAGLDLSRLAEEGFAGAASLLAGAPGTLAVVREMASGVLPRLSRSAALLRYQAYLSYLDDLASLYAGELRSVAPTRLPGFPARSGG